MAFEWFSNLFKAKDPEAGVAPNEFESLGRPQGKDEGTGEGTIDWGKMSKQQYADVGRSFQQAAPQLIGSGINSGFDQNWLGEQSSAGSAEGQHL